MQRDKLRVVHRHWLAGKLDRAQYGERAPQEVSLSVGNLFLAAMRGGRGQQGGAAPSSITVVERGGMSIEGSAEGVEGGVVI